MAKKLDVVIPPTDKTAEEVAKALFKLAPHATKPNRARKSSFEGDKPTAASASPNRGEKRDPRSDS